MNSGIETNICYSAFNLSNFDNNAVLKIIDNLQTIIQTSTVLQSSFAFLTSDRYQVKLLHILDEANVPHYLFEDIQKWAKDAYNNGYCFDYNRSTRHAEIEHLKRWLNLDCIVPQTVDCVLPGPLYQVVPVTRFDFSAQLISLLTTDSLVSNLENLDINPKNPFGRYVSQDGKLSCFNSGQWYTDAYDYCITDPERELFLPICFACDETKLQANGKTGCCPVMFTTTLFNQQLRNTPVVWRPLGYVYDLSIIESSAERERQSNDLKYSRYHSIFAKILETYILAQKGFTLKGIKIKLGNETRIVDIKVPCAFIIGDIQGGDKLCCSSPCYLSSMNHICCKCNVSGADVGNANILCKNIKMNKIINLVKLNQIDALEKLNQYNVYSAWFDVDYGGCRFGVFSAAMPIEPLHSLENGLMTDCLTILFNEEFNKQQCKSLDELTKQLKTIDRQYYVSSGSQKQMPTLLWKSGISTLTNLKAHEKVGIMLTIVVLSLTNEGRDLFDLVLKDEEKRLNMQEVFQMMLCYWSWLKKEKYWKRGDGRSKQKFKDSIKKMLIELNRLWPRMKGQGWAKAKFHEQLHVPDDIERNGAPMNTHTGPTEHNHIEFVKNPARRTQRRQDELDKQIANRFAESYIIKSANFAIEQNYNISHKESSNADSTVLCKTACRAGTIMLFKDNNNDITYYLDTQNDSVLTLDASVFLNFCDKINDVVDLNWKAYNGTYTMVQFNMFFEYKRNGVLFRTHNNYRSNGRWHDWVMVRWQSDNPARDQPDLRYTPSLRYGDTGASRKSCYTPAKIVGLFFQLSTEFETTVDNVYTVIWPCMYDFKKSSVFTLRWQLSFDDRQQEIASLEVVSCESIVRHTCMIPEELVNNNGSVFYHEIWPRELWGDEF